jgi:hypothetical protein
MTKKNAPCIQFRPKNKDLVHMDQLEALKAKLQAFAGERDWDQFHSHKNLSPKQYQAVIDEMADYWSKP